MKSIKPIANMSVPPYEINAANTLKMELNFNGAEMVVKAERGFRVSGEYRTAGG